MPERTVASGQESTSRLWAGTEPSRANDINGWQIVVADSLEPAHLGLQREHNIASEVGTGAHGPAIFIWRSQQALIVARGQNSLARVRTRSCGAGADGLAGAGP